MAITIEKLIADRTKPVEMQVVAMMNRLDYIERQRAAEAVDNKSTNRIEIGKNSINWIVPVLLAVIGLLGYIAYVASWGNHQGDARPPEAPRAVQPE